MTSRLRLPLASALAVMLFGTNVTALAAPLDRKLSVAVSIDGHQDWKNELQWSKATTTQQYTFSTTLRSDGKLHAPNLLDPDRDTRLAIKTEYLRQKGLAMLKSSGFDPDDPGLGQKISSRAQLEMNACKGDMDCFGEVSMKFAMLQAAAAEPDNSHLFAGEGRYQYFFGYDGCANTIRAVNKYQASGETAYGRKKDKIHPYALSYDGDSAGSEQDRRSLCQKYTVVVDTKEQKMFVENVYIPASRGKVVRTEFEKTQTSEADLPQPAPLQEWVNNTLRHAALKGTANTTLPLTMPLDGNSTVLGAFTGEAKTALNWSWTEFGAAK